MNEDQREILEQWARDYPTAREGSPSTIDLAAGHIRDRREAATVAELSAQIDELGLSLAMRRDIADAVELAAPAISARVPDQPTVAPQANAAHDSHVDAITAAISGDRVGLQTALAAHARTLYGLLVDTPVPTEDARPSQPSTGNRMVGRAQAKPSATGGYGLLSGDNPPTGDARQGRGVAGTFPLIGGGPLRGGPG